MYSIKKKKYCNIVVILFESKNFRCKHGIFGTEQNCGNFRILEKNLCFGEESGGERWRFRDVDAQNWCDLVLIAQPFQYGLLSLSKHQQHGRLNEEIWCPNGNFLLKGKAGSILHILRSIPVFSVF